MGERNQSVLSVVVPVYNEAAGIARFHATLMTVLRDAPLGYEVLYVDDGSLDDSAKIIAGLCEQDRDVRLLKLTRNFGKEIATTAGLYAARGDAILTLDADGQHPVDAIPRFVAKWRRGALVVVGVRSGREAPFFKRVTARAFYALFHRLTGVALDPNASDFRLIDKTVQAEFNRMNERNRITRGLIDWLGHDREYVTYRENPRLAGDATYSFRKLLKLSVDSAVSLSISPLYLAAYAGAVVLPLSVLLGLVMLVNAACGDPLHLHATGGAYVTVLILLLVGILLVSQGIVGLYLSHIHAETQNRPLYVVDELNSKGLNK